MVGPGWFSCCVGDKYKAVDGAVRDAEPHEGPADAGLPRRLDLAVPVGANKALAVDWIKAYTSNQSMTALRAIGNIPNTTSLLGNSVNERAARRSWFVPTAKNWVNVENGNVLRTMLAPDPHREADRQAGGAVGQRQHHVGPQRIVTIGRDADRLEPSSRSPA